jgi:hypothetical protein
MVAVMYMVLKVVLDKPVVRRIGSVNAQNPVDCPGRENITKAHEITKIKQFFILLFTALNVALIYKKI